MVGKCKYCNITIHNHKLHLQRHEKTEKHQKLIAGLKNSTPIENIFHENTREGTMTKRAEIKVAAFLAAHNLPFMLSDSLVPLIANICPDSKIAQKMSMGRTKTTAIVHEVGSQFSCDLADHLRQPGNYFSVIMDETTDLGSVKQCAMTVIYYKSHKVITEFWDMVEKPRGQPKIFSKRS